MSAKEVARRAMSTAPAVAALRATTHNQVLPASLRRKIYYRVAKKARPADQVFEHRPPGGSIVRLHLDGTIRELFWVGEYEADALPTFVEYARRSKGILDVGAAEGVYALFAAAVAPDATIVAFEPGSEQIPRVRANLDLNPALSARIQLVEAALSDHDGEATFFELPGGTSSLNAGFRSNTTPRTVRVARGDAVLSEVLGDTEIDLIKIDTESTEPEVLAGLRATIARDRPVIVCEVLAGRTEPRLQAFVDEHDYHPWWLSADGPVRRPQIVGVPGWVNWLFLPHEGQPVGASTK